MDRASPPVAPLLAAVLGVVFNVFIEALYHLNTTGKPLFPYP